MVIFCDLDNTLCKTQGSDYENAKPIPKNIKKINKLFTLGHKIVIWTGRGNTSGRNWSELTVRQLREWEVLYHELSFDKRHFDLLIDDKAQESKEYFK